MIEALLIIMLLAPLVAAAIALAIQHPRVVEMTNLLAALIVFACVLSLPFIVKGGVVFLYGYISIEPLSAWVLLCTGIVYLLASIYAVGYMRMLGEPERLPLFYTLFATFALTMLLAPLMNNIGLYWIAIELTTLVSTFLVGFEHAAEAIEAAWKYIMIVSAGISLALLGTIFLYWDGSLVLGPTYQMTWQVMQSVAPKLSQPVLLLAFLLMLIGYGTKVGLAPMHNWLPDAHSEGPAPVSVMLSGALLNTAMLGIVRFLAIADAAGIGKICHIALIILGALSLLVATLFIVRQNGVKRLMAYSSIEHMGVIALGFGFGGTLGIAGSLYHMVNHSLNKSLMFFGAGNAMRGYGTKEIGKVRAMASRYPVQALVWLAGAIAITGAPPFGLFLSEFTILRAGFQTISAWAAYLMTALLIVIFIGFINQFRRMYDEPVTDDTPVETTALSLWCTVPMVMALTPLLVFGLWWPAAFWSYFRLIAAQLGVGVP
jgi:hydrogenase-4 component F